MSMSKDNFLVENPTWVLPNLDNTHPTTKLQALEINTNSQTNQETKSVKKRGNQGQRSFTTRRSSDDSDGANNKEDGGGGDGGVGAESDHEIHIWTERERRKKMRTMFANLQALIPQLPSKVDKSTIIDEAVNYIKSLEETVKELQKQKQDRKKGITTFCYEPSSSREAFLADQGGSNNNYNNIITTKSSNIVYHQHQPVQFQTWTSSNVILNICGEEAQISICSTKKHGLFTTICYVLEKHNMEIISAHVCSTCNQSMYMIQARVKGASDKFADTIPLEEIYRQAASEIMCWVCT